MTADRVIINADGASRHNPGPAAIGATIKDEQGRLLASISRRIGRATNNQAEYQALIDALEKAVGLGARQVDIRLDSELVVRQMQGRYRVKNAALRPLYLRVGELLSQFEGSTITNVPREQNAEADRLANKALRRDNSW
ncbi:MAG TPA: ribonuclease HI family protein [Dehalococcoidia bacterium]|nr:ribonuclease HI family protein [Dehalococcoidia bacterium]